MHSAVCSLAAGSFLDPPLRASKHTIASYLCKGELGSDWLVPTAKRNRSRLFGFIHLYYAEFVDVASQFRDWMTRLIVEEGYRWDAVSA